MCVCVCVCVCECLSPLCPYTHTTERGGAREEAERLRERAKASRPLVLLCSICPHTRFLAPHTHTHALSRTHLHIMRLLSVLGALAVAGVAAGLPDVRRGRVGRGETQKNEKKIDGRNALRAHTRTLSPKIARQSIWAPGQGCLVSCSGWGGSEWVATAT